MPKKQRRQQQRVKGSRRQVQKQKTSGGRSQLLWGGLLVLAAVVVFVFAITHQSSTKSGSPSRLAPTVDGIKCQTSEVLVYHIHQHLAVYLDGKQVTVPTEIGIPGGDNNPTCFYWIHVHIDYPMGIIHVESPKQKTYTLGDFVDIWKATKTDTIPAGDSYLTKLKAAASRGEVTVFYNGRPWRHGYRSVPLTSHANIAVEIGKPVVTPKTFTSWQGL